MAEYDTSLKMQANIIFKLKFALYFNLNTPSYYKRIKKVSLLMNVKMNLINKS